MQRSATTTPGRVLTYRFSGAIFASSFHGVLAGDRFFGRFRFDPDAARQAGRISEGRSADPGGFVDAMVGAVQLRSDGPLEILVREAPAILRVALSTRRVKPGDCLIAAGASLLVSRPPSGEVLLGALDPSSFATRTVILESTDDPGFAEGTLDMLYPLEADAA